MTQHHYLHKSAHGWLQDAVSCCLHQGASLHLVQCTLAESAYHTACQCSCLVKADHFNSCKCLQLGNHKHIYAPLFESCHACCVCSQDDCGYSHWNSCHDCAQDHGNILRHWSLVGPEVRYSCNEEDAQLEDQRKSTEAKQILHSQPHSARRGVEEELVSRMQVCISPKGLQLRSKPTMLPDA